ncbi:MAG: RNA-binding S4 domain-containing protein [Nitrospirota bacterium]
MRLDIFLKTSRLIKRRSVAKELCDRGMVEVGGAPAKAGREIKAGDVLTIALPRRKLTVSVLEIPSGNVTKEKAAALYKVTVDLRVEEEF